MKLLEGTELADYIKERQSKQVRSLPKAPTLAIIRDNDSPVISTYVHKKQAYGSDIGVKVVDHLVPTADLSATIQQANSDPAVTGIILQLPILDPQETDALIAQIAPAKDVDGLNPSSPLDSATALAIHHLLAAPTT